MVGQQKIAKPKRLENVKTGCCEDHKAKKVVVELLSYHLCGDKNGEAVSVAGKTVLRGVCCDRDTIPLWSLCVIFLPTRILFCIVIGGPRFDFVADDIDVSERYLKPCKWIWVLFLCNCMKALLFLFSWKYLKYHFLLCYTGIINMSWILPYIWCALKIELS